MSTHLKPASNLALLDDLKNLIKRSTKVMHADKRQDYTKLVGESLVSLINELSRQGKECSNGGWEKIKGDWRELHYRMMYPLPMTQQLKSPANAKEFFAAVGWMSEQGMEDELDSLLEVKERPPQFDEQDLFGEHTPEKLRLLVESAVDKIRERLSDPDYVLGKGEEAYQKNKAEWAEKYKGQFIAIHRGEVVAADADEGQVARQLIELQRQNGRFTAYVVEVGAPILYARGPRVRLRESEPSDGEDG